MLTETFPFRQEQPTARSLPFSAFHASFAEHGMGMGKAALSVSGLVRLAPWHAAIEIEEEKGK